MSLSDTQIADFARTLETLKYDLERESAASAGDRKPVELDQQSVGRLSRQDSLQVQAMAKASDSRRISELRRIDAAMQRLRAGDFGLCVNCDEDIAIKRLRLDPAAALCVACAGGD